MEDEARAEARSVDFAARYRVEMLMRVVVVGLEDAKGQAMIEPGRLVINAAAGCEDDAPLAVRIVSAGDAFASDEGVDEGRDVFGWEAGNQAAGDAGELIVDDRRMVSAILMKIAFCLNAQEFVEVARDA